MLTSDISRGTKKTIPKSRKVPSSYCLKTVSMGFPHDEKCFFKKFFINHYTLYQFNLLHGVMVYEEFMLKFGKNYVRVYQH